MLIPSLRECTRAIRRKRCFERSFSRIKHAISSLLAKKNVLYYFCSSNMWPLKKGTNRRQCLTIIEQPIKNYFILHKLTEKDTWRTLNLPRYKTKHCQLQEAVSKKCLQKAFSSMGRLLEVSKRNTVPKCKLWTRTYGFACTEQQLHRKKK